MGRLAGHSYREVIAQLQRLGFVFHRHAAGLHEIWTHPTTGRRTTIPNHLGDVPEGTFRVILRQAGVTPDAFLAA